MIVNRRQTLKRPVTGPGEPLSAIQETLTPDTLRWFVSESDADELQIETTEVTGVPAIELPARMPLPPGGKTVVVSVIPTGIGCEVGGYAGDGAPATALLAEAADLVVTNPNAVNASNFIHASDKVVYTEGYCLSLFSRGEVNLYRPTANRVGVIVENADPTALDTVHNIINTVRAVYGVDIRDVIVTDEKIGTNCVRGPSGAYTGTVDRPDVLLDAARRLVDSGVTAIAVTTNVQGLTAADYTDHFLGTHPNPVGGAEAVISHLITRTLAVPAAHAPMINFKDIASGPVVDARGAGEFASTSGLACVLIGLRRAPQIVRRPGNHISEAIAPDHVLAVVTPADALGGEPVLHAVATGIPVIAVRNNATILDVTAERLRLTGVIEAASYAEAAGLILALRSGVSLEAIRRPMATLGQDVHAYV